MVNIPVTHPVASSLILALLLILVLPAETTLAQSRFEGTAIVERDGGKYTVPIECENATRPELGFSTEPSRITRERTGRASRVNVRIRPSGEPDEVIVTLDRYTGWFSTPQSESGVLLLTLDLSPITIMKDGQPVMLTRDMWIDGERPEGIAGVKIEAQCTVRDPDAPSYEKLPDGP